MPFVRGLFRRFRTTRAARFPLQEEKKRRHDLRAVRAGARQKERYTFTFLPLLETTQRTQRATLMLMRLDVTAGGGRPRCGATRAHYSQHNHHRRCCLYCNHHHRHQLPYWRRFNLPSFMNTPHSSLEYSAVVAVVAVGHLQADAATPLIAAAVFILCVVAAFFTHALFATHPTVRVHGCVCTCARVINNKTNYVFPLFNAYTHTRLPTHPYGVTFSSNHQRLIVNTLPATPHRAQKRYAPGCPQAGGTER